MIELYKDWLKKALKMEEGQEMWGHDSEGTRFCIKSKGYYLVLYYEGEKIDKNEKAKTD